MVPQGRLYQLCASKTCSLHNQGKGFRHAPGDAVGSWASGYGQLLEIPLD